MGWDWLGSDLNTKLRANTIMIMMLCCFIGKYISFSSICHLLKIFGTVGRTETIFKRDWQALKLTLTAIGCAAIAAAGLKLTAIYCY